MPAYSCNPISNLFKPWLQSQAGAMVVVQCYKVLGNKDKQYNVEIMQKVDTLQMRPEPLTKEFRISTIFMPITII